jgi:molybdopterin-binding protein
VNGRGAAPRATRGTRAPARRGAFVARQEANRMQLSARNQLKATVKSVKTGSVMAEVVLDVAGDELVAVITKGSVDRLGLKAGDQVTAIIKATEILVGK